MRGPRVVPLGDSALLLRFGAGGEEAARAAASSLRASGAPGLRDIVVAYDTLAIHFDPLAAAPETLARLALRGGPPAPTPAAETALHTIRVRYDGADLTRVAEACGLQPAEVIELHASVEYRVRAVGFVPGFAYLGELDERLRLPRRAAPRPRVPAGSVAIAGAQTAVYPFVTPGGWHLIGRTDAETFDPRCDPPALLAVGARVRFVPW